MFNKWIEVGEIVVFFRPVDGGWTTHLTDEDMKLMLGDKYEEQEQTMRQLVDAENLKSVAGGFNV